MLWLQHLNSTISLGSEEQRATDGYKLISNQLQRARWGSVCSVWVNNVPVLCGTHWTRTSGLLDWLCGLVHLSVLHQHEQHHISFCFWSLVQMLVEWNLLRDYATLHKYTMWREAQKVAAELDTSDVLGGGLLRTSRRNKEDWRTGDQREYLHVLIWNKDERSSVLLLYGCSRLPFWHDLLQMWSCTIGLLMQL